jgi:hypothetical protein
MCHLAIPAHDIGEQEKIVKSLTLCGSKLEPLFYEDGGLLEDYTWTYDRAIAPIIIRRKLLRSPLNYFR